MYDQLLTVLHVIHSALKVAGKVQLLHGYLGKYVMMYMYVSVISLSFGLGGFFKGKI